MRREEKRQLTNFVLHADAPHAVKESNFQDLTLAEYTIAKEENCREYHRDCKVNCQEMVQVSKIVLQRKLEPLPSLWRKTFKTPYDCEKTQRRLLQMPIAVLKMNGSCAVVEKRKDGCYDTFFKEMSHCSTFSKPVGQRGTGTNVDTSHEEFASFLSALPSHAERERIKHLLASSHNMSARQSGEFGVRNSRKRAEKVHALTKRVNRIKSKNLYFAKVEQNVFLQSVGRDPHMYLSSSESSDSDSESDTDIDTESTVQRTENNDCSASSEITMQANDSEIQRRNLVIPADVAVNCDKNENCPSISNDQIMVMDEQPTEDILSSIDVNIALNILREVEWNWFSFVANMESLFSAKGHTQEMLDKFIVIFSYKLHSFGLCDAELNLAETSRQVYLLEMMRKHAITEDDGLCETSSSEESSDDDDDQRVSGSMHDETVRRKLKLIQDKWKKKAQAEIAANQLYLRKKPTGNMNSIERRHPDIGDVMENIVKAADVGADKWRRTGVYTFTGNRKVEKKMTYKRLQQKLIEHYGEKISYGTVVQLCVPRNKRKLSRKRYKGVANIKYQRARKGFNLKFNPDSKWSRSLYKCLDQLQNDGKHMLLLNRDDQAGFRLDTTFTHKSAPSLNANGSTITTHTDFVNKHQSQLQTTSYILQTTSYKTEVCAGVVKASMVHQKDPSQHAADINMLQKNTELNACFYKDNGDVKDIECVRVDGASDEGPSHIEVQFLWTERHMQRPTKVTLVTTRCSGDSFLNRVELQNGCLSKGHSNLFIPSTLGGEPYDEDGQFEPDKHKDNMQKAVEMYIERVGGTPCMSTSISLYQGATGSSLTERRNRLLVFLKGSAKAKEELRKKNPTEYQYYEKVWKVRHNHMDRTLPSKYAFLLKCCAEENCPHPLCLKGGKDNSKNHDVIVNKVPYCTCRKEATGCMICCDQCGEWYHYRCIGMSQEEGRRMSDEDMQFVCETCRQPNDTDHELIPKWSPGGPAFTYFPYPVIDEERPWGSECERCGGTCTGHFVTEVNKLLDLRKNAKAIRSLPPSIILKEAFENDCANDHVSLAKRCCLSIQDINLWIDNLKRKKVTKEKGVEKAKETRRKKKQAKK